MRKISLDVVPTDKEWFSKSDIATLIGRTTALLTMLYKRGKFVEFDRRIGNSLYYKRSTVIKFLENYEQYASNPSRFKGSKNGKRSSKKVFKQLPLIEETAKNEPNS